MQQPVLQDGVVERVLADERRRQIARDDTPPAALSGRESLPVKGASCRRRS
jgi:hypothetical protein